MHFSLSFSDVSAFWLTLIVKKRTLCFQLTIFCQHFNGGKSLIIGRHHVESHSNCCSLNRGSYMSAPVLLNLFNELGKSDKMRGLLSIFDAFSQRV